MTPLEESKLYLGCQENKNYVGVLGENFVIWTVWLQWKINTEKGL